MDERFWNLEPFMGRQLYIEIVDDCSSLMGHINVDSIKELPFPPLTGSASPTSGEFVLVKGGDQGQAAIPVSAPEGAATPCPSEEVSCSPNPFNPVTTISFTASPRSLVEVVVFSIAGKRIRTETVMSSSDGTGSVVWDGRSDCGQQVASGIYAAAVLESGRIVGMTKLVLLR